MARTNAMRFLESQDIPYTLHTFSAEKHSAVEVAELVGVPPEMVYKTLVVLRERGKPLLVMIAGDERLDLKLLAKELGEKKLQMASQDEAEELTKLQVGGISPLMLLNKGFDIYIDKPALAQDEILVSAGKRGMNLQLEVDALIQVTGARVVEATSQVDGPTR
jgi:Cys-tRNA(Pro)/Cys-tRNA(Cys) deacylase